MNENDAAELMNALIKALIHSHSKNIAHRDLKPENIMFNSEEGSRDFSDVKIIDFGLAAETNDSFGMLWTDVGTSYFKAPEIYEGSYGKKCDVWSLGVILYMLLSGWYPYNSDSPTELYYKIQKLDVKFPDNKWGHISEDAKDLLINMIDRSPNSRFTFEECLKHKWFGRVKVVTKSRNKINTGM